MSGLRIWITRALPAAEATAERVREMGHAPLVDPLMEVSALHAVADLSGIAALAFTSANGVRAFQAASPERDLTVFAVGEATAKAARDAGFTRVQASAGDVRTLSAMIGGQAADIHGMVLHLSAREPADDLSSLLTRRNVPSRRLDLYETVEIMPDSALASLAEIDVVLVHSPKAGRRLAALLALMINDFEGDGPTFCCISANTAEPLVLLGLEKVRIAAFPDEAGVLKLIDEEVPRTQ
jgi:uroporphyrinogen-III synthase